MGIRLKVVVPVYAGAAVIGDTLQALAGQLSADMALAVVINGPADGALAVAEPVLDAMAKGGAWAGIQRLARASRSAALTAGDAMGPSGGHRLYLDQDAVLGARSLSRIVAALDGGADFVAGVARWRGPCPHARRAMDCWSALPYVRRSPATAGMYAVSARGRTRWGAWPEGLPDDKFARMHFASGERRLLEDVGYGVQAPPTIAALIAARRRYRAYNRALAAERPDLMVRDRGRTLLGNLAGLPARHWLGAAILGGTEIAARARP